MKFCMMASLILTATSVTVGTQTSDERSKIELHKRVLAMKKPDVAWRKIEWKTCLIDALHDSKEQKKPIIAWVFIDRPKDDERC